ncbi:LysR family transcriptional regulator [Erwinia amylovora]
MDRLTSMRVFVRAAELGSFAAAAEDLRISAQMVAKQVAWLESRLGTTLISRTTRRQHLTDIGRNYYERCKIVLAEADAADAVALEMKSSPSGTIRINAPVTFGAATFAPFVTEYLGKYPHTQVELTLTDRYVDPLEEGFEVIIRIGELSNSPMIAYPLRPYRLIACASAAYLAQHGTPERPADLAQHSCLVYGIWSASLPCRWLFSKDGKIEEVRPEGRFRSNNWPALLHAALQGYGVTLGPVDILQKEIDAGRLIQILPAYSGPMMPVHILLPPGQRQSAKISSFVQAILSSFG